MPHFGEERILNEARLSFARLHYSVYKDLGTETTDTLHTPKPAYEQEDVTVLWNLAVHTEREVTANRPDIIIKNKKEKTRLPVGVAIPTDGRVV
jgi:hypothetical protein